MKVRALKKRAGLKLRRAIRRRAFDRALCELGGGIAEELAAIRAQWDAALRQMVRAITSGVAEAVRGAMHRTEGGATSPSFAETLLRDWARAMASHQAERERGNNGPASSHPISAAAHSAG